MCTTKTRKVYVNLYPWFCVLDTVQGSDTVESYGQLSEEAQESHKKDRRRFKEGRIKNRNTAEPR